YISGWYGSTAHVARWYRPTAHPRGREIDRLHDFRAAAAFAGCQFSHKCDDSQVAICHVFTHLQFVFVVHSVASDNRPDNLHVISSTAQPNSLHAQLRRTARVSISGTIS